MKKHIFLLGLALILSGCATADWNNFMYGNKNGPVQIYGFQCDNCNRTFTGTNDTGGNISEYINCPYCGIRLNTSLANNRYLYYQQQQESQANQQTLSNIAQQMRDTQIRHDEAQQRNTQAFQQNIANWNANWQKSHNQVGTKSNPVHVTIDDN